jgi:hypothetical protein
MNKTIEKNNKSNNDDEAYPDAPEEGGPPNLVPKMAGKDRQ